MAARRLGMVLAGLILGMCSGALYAQDQQDAADDAFRKGLQAINDKKYAEAVTHFQTAFKLDPAESTRTVRPGGFRAVVPGAGTQYLPLHHLGLAYAGQNLCTDALDAWGRSERAGAIARADSKYLRDLRAGTGTCEQRGFLPNGKLEAAVSSVSKQIDTAREGAAEAAKSDLLTGDRRNRLNQVSDEIKQADSHLENLRKSRASRELTEAQQAVVRATTLIGALRSELADAAKVKTTVESLLADLERGIQQGQGIDRAIDSKRAYLNDALSADRQKAVQMLTSARRVAEAAKAAGAEADTSKLREAGAEVTTANGQMQRVFDDLAGLEIAANRNRNAAVLRQARDKFRLADQAFATFDGRVKARPSVDPTLTAERQSISRRVRTARGQLETAAASGNVDAIEEAGRVADRERSRIVALTSQFGPLTLEERGVHPLLVQAFTVFQTGDFAKARATLSPVEPFPTDMLFIEHVYLIRAAALHAQHLASGGVQASLLDAARKEVGALKDLNPAFQPDARVFSPRFIEFFRLSPASALPPVSSGAGAVAP